MVWMIRLPLPAYIALAAMLLCACTRQLEPAQKAISDIDAVLSANAEQAARYVPEQLGAVRGDLDALKASFGRRDYAAVLAGAPAVMSAAHALAGAATVKKGELAKALNDQWAVMAAALPDAMTAIQNRIDQLAKKAGKKDAAGIDLDEARSSLSGAVSLWSKAQAAFATGNMSEAVASAKTLGANLQALAASLKLQLPLPPAVAPS